MLSLSLLETGMLLLAAKSAILLVNELFRYYLSLFYVSEQCCSNYIFMQITNV